MHAESDNAEAGDQAARDEAFTRYTGDVDVVTGAPMDDYGYADCKRRAFIAGAAWQSERPVTDAEVEAGARSLCESSKELLPWKEAIPTDYFKAEARAVLEAARKARM